ncbi:MAG: afsR [Chthoniobacteraceae bacterium]|nr:afsR [Chthoniobacteraceae bacterium]
MAAPHYSSRTPFLAPDFPTGFVARPDEYEPLLKLLLGDEDLTPVSITTALHGTGGYGKTTLATALCHDPNVRAAFPDGILWATLGHHASPASIQRELTKLYEAVSGDRRTFQDETQAGIKLGEKLDSLRCLLVIDDVWEDADLKPFFRGGSASQRLITTRIFHVAPNARRIRVDEMTAEEAVKMLTGRLLEPPADATPFEQLAKRLGEWPLLLKLAAGAIWTSMEYGESLEGALEYVNAAFTERGVIAFDREDSRQRDEAIATTVQLSTSHLKLENRQRFCELAIFPEDTEIPLSTLQQFWGLSFVETTKCAQLLANHSLIELNLKSHMVSLHDVMRVYLAGQLPHSQLTHSRLLEAWGDFLQLPNAYAWRWAPWHLKQAGWEVEFSTLLFNFDWLQAKFGATNVDALLADFDWLKEDEDARLVQSAIRLSAHMLAHNPKQLAGHLVGRLLGSEKPRIQGLVAKAQEWRGANWLCPLHSNLTSPGGGLIYILEGHVGSVNGVAVSADGRRAVSASDDETLRVWDLETGRCLRILKGHSFWVNGVAVSADGRRAVSASDDETLRVWDLESGRCLYTLEGHSFWVNGVAMSADGHRAVSASDDETLRVWDLETGQCLRILKGHSFWVNGVAVSADGRRTISASSDETLRVWDLESRHCLRILEGHVGSVNGVAVSADGRWAISASDDATLRVWDLESGHCLRILKGHGDSVKGVAVSADGRRAVSASDDATLRVWDLDPGYYVRTFESHAGSVKDLAVSADGRWVVSASDDETLRVWDLKTGRCLRTLENYSFWVNGVAVSSVGPRAVSASKDMTLRDLESGQNLRILKGHAGSVKGVAVSADGRRAISASYDETLRVWDLESGQCLRVLKGHGGSVKGVAVSADGCRAISASYDATLRVWDLESGQCLRILIDHAGSVNGVAVSADGRRAISASDDATLRVWDLESGQCLAVFNAEADFQSCAIAPDGHTIIAGDSSSRVHFLRLIESAKNTSPEPRPLIPCRKSPPAMSTSTAIHTHDVFLAHNSQDKPAMRTMNEALKNRGLKPWLDEDEIPPGTWFQDVIQLAIPKVKAAVICLGPQGLGDWQEAELRILLHECVKRKIPLIPVLLPGVHEVPPHLLFLNQLHWVQICSLPPDKATMNALEWGITGKKP